MKNVTFEIANKLTDELINLRRVDFFNNEFDNSEIIDEFDEFSTFPLLKIDNEIIGTTRITDTSVLSSFEKWSKGKDITPKGQNCYEITRTVIAKYWQNKAMYHLLSICILKYLKEHNATNVNSVLEIGFNLKNYFQRFGSMEYGEPYMCYDPPCIPVLVQAYSLDISDESFAIIYQKESERILNAINNRGFNLIYPYNK